MGLATANVGRRASAARRRRVCRRRLRSRAPGRMPARLGARRRPRRLRGLRRPDRALGQADLGRLHHARRHLDLARDDRSRDRPRPEPRRPRAVLVRGDARQPPSSGYPIGAFLPLGVAGKLAGTDIAWLFQPAVAFAAAMLALGLYALAGQLVRSRRLCAAVAFVAGKPALLFAYAMWSGIKEVTAAALVALARVGRCRGGARRLAAAPRAARDRRRRRARHAERRRDRVARGRAAPRRGRGGPHRRACGGAQRGLADSPRGRALDAGAR